MAQKENGEAARMVEEHYGGVRKVLWGMYTAEIRYPGQKKMVCLGTFDTDEEAVRAYDAAVNLYRVQKALSEDFLEKLKPKNVRSDNNNSNHILPYHQTSDIGSSSGTGGRAVRLQVPNQTPKFRRSPAVNEGSVPVTSARSKHFLDPFIGIGVAMKDPDTNQQKETLDFIGLGANGDEFWHEVQVQIQPSAARAEPPLNLDLSLGQPGTM